MDHSKIMLYQLSHNLRKSIITIKEKHFIEINAYMIYSYQTKYIENLSDLYIEQTDMKCIQI